LNITPKEMGRLVSLKKYGFKSIPKSILVVCLITALLVVVGVITWKPLRVLNLQARGGEKIEDYIQTYAPDFENYFACQIPAFIDLPEDQGLTEAVSLLEKAQALQPENAQTHLLLGRAYCLQKDYESAVEAFESYSKGRPDNPLGDLETAFAHFTLAVKDNDLTETDKNAHEIQSRLILEEEGYSGDYFLEEGNSAFNRWINPDYRAAWYLYKLSEIFRLSPTEIAFKTAIMDVAFKDETSFLEFIEEEQIVKLEDKNNILPSSFFRLEDGSPVNTREFKGQMAGMYYRNRDPGVTILEVLDSGSYCLFIKAFDTPPEPTIIELTIDFKPLTMIEMQNGDETWRSYEIETYLEEGLHLLGIRLTNDGNVNGIDRNGSVGEILIESCQN